MIEAADLDQLTADVWQAILGLEFEAGSDLERHGALDLTGCVQVTGEWTGAVTVTVSEAMARQAASIMFGLEPAATEQADIQDALGELANMVGGSVKALLPGPCHLSLPAVVVGVDYSLIVPGTSPLTRIGKWCDGEAVNVAVLKRDGKKGRDRIKPGAYANSGQ